METLRQRMTSEDRVLFDRLAQRGAISPRWWCKSALG